MTDAMAAEVARLNNIEQVQTRLGVGRSKVFELIKSKKLRSVRVGRRRLVTERSLRDFIAQLDGAEDKDDLAATAVRPDVTDRPNLSQADRGGLDDQGLHLSVEDVLKPAEDPEVLLLSHVEREES